jgi:hypothetical protein
MGFLLSEWSIDSSLKWCGIQTKLNWAHYCYQYSLEPAIKKTDCFFYCD